MQSRSIRKYMFLPEHEPSSWCNVAQKVKSIPCNILPFLLPWNANRISESREPKKEICHWCLLLSVSCKIKFSKSKNNAVIWILTCIGRWMRWKRLRNSTRFKRWYIMPQSLSGSPLNKMKALYFFRVLRAKKS